MKIADLPDFDEMIEVAEKLGELSRKKYFLDLAIKKREADIVLICTSDEKYFQKGKVPSMDFIKNTYMFKGLESDGNLLLETREEYYKVVSEIEELKLKYDIMKAKIDVYRTESANNRQAVL